MFGHLDGVRGSDDGGCIITRPARKALPELFREEGHKGVDHCEAAFEGGVECVLGGALFLLGATGNDCFGVFDVGVAKVGVPVLVSDARGG